MTIGVAPDTTRNPSLAQPVTTLSPDPPQQGACARSGALAAQDASGRPLRAEMFLELSTARGRFGRCGEQAGIDVLCPVGQSDRGSRAAVPAPAAGSLVDSPAGWLTVSACVFGLKQIEIVGAGSQTEDVISDTSWQPIRALRAAPTGSAAADHDRRATFVASLRQAEELAEAARVAGYAARPLPLFYCLSQAGRAIAAAHLPAVT
jgi:hypothetical protein